MACVASEELPQDIPYLLARGQGVFVGATALVMNPTSVPSSWGNWWGEGDEKVFVDDDATPSTFGTGSEDYFNYAWSSSRIFTHAFCGQPRNDGPANRGFVTNYRWQILDSMPFRERFDFFMELFSHEPVPGFSYARIAYHYGAPEIVDDHMLITDRDVEPLRLPDELDAHRAEVHEGNHVPPGRRDRGGRPLGERPPRATSGREDGSSSGIRVASAIG